MLLLPDQSHAMTLRSQKDPLRCESPSPLVQSLSGELSWVHTHTQTHFHNIYLFPTPWMPVAHTSATLIFHARSYALSCRSGDHARFGVETPDLLKWQLGERNQNEIRKGHSSGNPCVPVYVSLRAFLSLFMASLLCFRVLYVHCVKMSSQYTFIQ